MARSFNGTSDLLTVAAAVATPPAITVAAWAIPNSTTGARSIFSLGNDGTANPILLFDINANNLRLFVRDDTASFQFGGTGATAVGTGTRHCAATLNSAGTASEVFLDGVSDGTGSGGPLGTWTLNRSAIGCLHSGGGTSNFFSGTIAEVGVWSAVLTASEIAALAKGHSPQLVRPSALVCYAPLVRGLSDVRGTTFTATGTAVADHVRIIMPKKRQPFSVTAAGGGGGVVGSNFLRHVAQIGA